MQGRLSHGGPYYRCRFPEQYALANRIQRPRNVFLREAEVIPPLDFWPTRSFASHRLEATIEAMADDTDNGAEVERARQGLRECDTRLVGYQAALDAGGDPAAVAAWMRGEGVEDQSPGASPCRPATDGAIRLPSTAKSVSRGPATLASDNCASRNTSTRSYSLQHSLAG
ncbi:hypothetical protein [Peterkaempfera bronchialis]|nr:hypothetical protein [Peterkaempfera bronchialis]